jgi:hypothetical protein
MSFKECMTGKGTTATREKFLKTDRGVDELEFWIRMGRRLNYIEKTIKVEDISCFQAVCVFLQLESGLSVSQKREGEVETHLLVQLLPDSILLVSFYDKMMIVKIFNDEAFLFIHH